MYIAYVYIFLLICINGSFCESEIVFIDLKLKDIIEFVLEPYPFKSEKIFKKI